MAKRKRLNTGVEWVQLETTAADWKAADPELLGTMLGQLHLIRAFEEAVLDLAGAGPCTAPRTPASVRRAARSVRSSPSDPRMP